MQVAKRLQGAPLGPLFVWGTSLAMRERASFARLPKKEPRDPVEPEHAWRG